MADQTGAVLLPEELPEMAEEVAVRTDEAHVGQRVRVAARLVLQDKYARSVCQRACFSVTATSGRVGNRPWRA